LYSTCSRTSLFTTVLTFDDGQAEDEENSLPYMDGFQSKLPPGIFSQRFHPNLILGGIYFGQIVLLDNRIHPLEQDGCPALNKVSWTPSHLAHPRIDEWNKFLYTQQDLKNNKANEKLDKLNLSSVSSSLTSMTYISSVPLR
ncbi:hypothetical protein ALC62_02969, partial [Cyphomyrmex costatus]